ncbi:hypothetical protein MUCCIDRAFT_182405 [Mucor lusitanicus CBS 277.49]|uniref:RING-type domain-containing protein n=1 Tax=Mucor lusitanicus CBS 277.49 TaxID=747725 RepID=A0A168PVB7_MUCCL|nr:hypothetical protein MUCCIDRAFT_182405 [Mucor lusitanicus CBS 277.49]
MPNIDLAFKPVSDQAGRMVESSWKRILAIAQNHVQEFEEHEDDMDGFQRSSNDTRRSRSTANSSVVNHQIHSSDQSQTDFYDRERHMVHALDTLFTLAYEGPGYLAFIATITCNLDPDSPVAMAFLSHIIDRAALPSRDTMASVSPVIISKLNKKPGRIQRMISLISGRYKIERSASKREALRNQIFHNTTNPPTTSTIMATVQNAEQTKLRLNAAILWSLLAEKFAGEMCLSLWHQDVGDMLMKSISDPQEDLMVRIFSLLALEKFALTGTVKDIILAHDFNIRHVLLSVVRECEIANERIFALAMAEDESRLISSQPLTSLALSSLTSMSSTGIASKMTTTNTASGDQVPAFSNLNSFDSRFIPPKGPLREEWAKYVQLGLCARWALDHITCPWDLTNLKVIMNPFDSTPHLKIGGNGLELRNDRPHFESVRATACVKREKWYYETLLLSNGIMQIGWATSRCRFSPEEGYGVGDDCNGFAFDTYRTAVWADGSAVYPQSKVKIRCQAGDVIGSFLDLDNGFCSYYINGCDLGLTVEFEHPNRKKHHRQHTSQHQHQQQQTRKSSETSSRSSNLSESTATTSTLHSLSNSSPKTTISSSSPTLTTSTSSPRLIEPSSKRGGKKPAKGLGLYPAISLTTHQQALVNFGEKAWMYPPPTTARFRGINEAGALDGDFEKRVLRWVKKRGVTSHGKSYQPMNKPPLRPRVGADEVLQQASPDSDSTTEVEEEEEEEEDYDWDGPLCTICFSEPKNTILMPCKHDGIGGRCAKVLTLCPLCRTEIHDRIPTTTITKTTFTTTTTTTTIVEEQVVPTPI